MSETQVEVQENKDLSLDEAFFEYLKQDIHATLGLFFTMKDNVLDKIARLNADEDLKVLTAFIIGRIQTNLLQLVDAVSYVFEKLGIQDNNYRYYVVNAVEALAKAYVDIMSKKPLNDVKNDLEAVLDELDNALSKAIVKLTEA
jgi:hypothetical protein